MKNLRGKHPQDALESSKINEIWEGCGQEVPEEGLSFSLVLVPMLCASTLHKKKLGAKPELSTP